MDNQFNIFIKKSFISNVLGYLSVLSIIISFYFYLIAEITLGVTIFRPIFLFVGYGLFAFSILFDSTIKIQKQLFVYLCSSLLIYLISFPFWLVKFDINIYLSTITAILIINKYKFFKKVMTIFIFLTFFFAAYEFFTKEYLFVVLRDTFFGFRPLDEKFFGGHSGIFRAKVYFEGPLALSQFTIGAALLFRDKINILYIILLISIFANGRLAIVVCAVITILYYIKTYNLMSIFLKPKNVLFIFIGFTGFSLAAFNLLDETSIDRLMAAFNTSYKGNAERINFWIKGFNMWIESDVLHFIFGNNGTFESVYKNNSENGWLTLLLNNGILGFSYYFIPLILIIINSIKKQPTDLIYVFLLILCMFVQTFHLGASANLFYWLIIYSFIANHNNVKTAA